MDEVRTKVYAQNCQKLMEETDFAPALRLAVEMIQMVQYTIQKPIKWNPDTGEVVKWVEEAHPRKNLNLNISISGGLSVSDEVREQLLIHWNSGDVLRVGKVLFIPKEADDQKLYKYYEPVFAEHVIRI